MADDLIGFRPQALGSQGYEFIWVSSLSIANAVWTEGRGLEVCSFADRVGEHPHGKGPMAGQMLFVVQNAEMSLDVAHGLRAVYKLDHERQVCVTG
jgi:hypothetical protein